MVVSYETICNAHRIARDNQIGYYDSLIAASAIEAGCGCLFSEDFNDGYKIEKRLSVINIFKHPEIFKI